MHNRNFRATLASAASLVSAGAVMYVAALSPLAAQTVEAFYTKTALTMAIGFGPGGSHDLNARVIARHMGQYLPGNPAIVPQNIPGAGSLRLANQLYQGAPRDGSIIGAIQRAAVFEDLYRGSQTSRAQFDPLAMNWLGAPDKITGVAVAWHTSPIKTVEDLLDREMIVGSAGGTTTTVPLIMQEVAGFRFRIIEGYQSGGEVDLAMERGEIEGRAATAWGGLKSRSADWLEQKRVNLLFQSGLEKHPELLDVPLALDFAKTSDDRRLLELFFAAEEIGYPYVAPPGVPDDRLAALRKAFAEVMRDQAFIEEMNKQSLDVNPVSWERMTEIIHNAYNAPDEIKTRLRKAIALDQGN